MANVARVAVRWVATIVHGIGEPVDTWEAVCTFHVMKGESEDPIDEDEREEINLRVIAWWEADNGGFVEVKSAYPLSIALTDVTTQTILPTPSDPTVAELLEPIPGTNVGTTTLHPPQCCLGIGLRTTTETRRARGRIFLPAYTTLPDRAMAGWVDPDQQVDLGHVAAHLAYEIRRIGALGVDDGPFVLCVYSRVAGDPTPVTHFDIPDRILTQRRRAIRPLTHLACALSDGEPL